MGNPDNHLGEYLFHTIEAYDHFLQGRPRPDPIRSLGLRFSMGALISIDDDRKFEFEATDISRAREPMPLFGLMGRITYPKKDFALARLNYANRRIKPLHLSELAPDMSAQAAALVLSEIMRPTIRTSEEIIRSMHEQLTGLVGREFEIPPIPVPKSD